MIYDFKGWMEEQCTFENKLHSGLPKKNYLKRALILPFLKRTGGKNWHFKRAKRLFQDGHVPN
jgi:hypothetical protein